MRYLIRCCLYFLLLLLPTSIAFTQETSERQSLTSAPESNPLNWHIFGYAEGRFSIEFPGTPEARKQPLDSAGQVVLYKYSFTTKAEYGVMYSDYAMKIDGVSAANRVLDDGAKGAVAAVDSELLSITEVSLNGNPGRKLKERMKDGAIMQARMFLVGQRLYQIAVTLPHLQNAPPEETLMYEQAATRFLNSFKLTQPSQSAWSEDCSKGSVKVDGAPQVGVVNGRALRLPRPEYPDGARMAYAQGIVEIQVVIDQMGKVIAAKPLKGNPMLYDASLKSARQARFSPTAINGQAVCVTGVIQYNFVRR